MCQCACVCVCVVREFISFFLLIDVATRAGCRQFCEEGPLLLIRTCPKNKKAENSTRYRHRGRVGESINNWLFVVLKKTFRFHFDVSRRELIAVVSAL